MRIVFLFLFAFAAIISCEQSGQDDIIDMSEVTPQAKERSSKHHEVKLPDTLNRFIDTLLLNELKLEVRGIEEIDNDLLPQRLSPKSSFAFKMRYKTDSLTYFHWSFKDSVYTKNALYNWLDCFGLKCKSIRIGENVNMQRKGLLIIVSDTSITYLTASQPLKKEDWVSYFEKRIERKDWRMLIEQKNNGKAKWYTVKELEFSPIELK